MTPAEYCQKKSAPIGSAVYYSLRKLTPDLKNAIMAVIAFYNEIENVTLTYVDLNVAQIKLNWWRDEVIKIQDGIPTHPVTLRLQEIQSTYTFSPLRLIEIIDGLEQNLTLPDFEKFEDVVVHLMRTAGQREILIAEILRSSIDVEVIYQFAIVIELTHYIQFLRTYVRRGLIYFSEEELRKFSVTENDLRNFKTNKAIADLLNFQMDKIRKIYSQALEKLTTLQRGKLKNILIRCEISCALLDAIQSSKNAVLESFIDLTPIRFWWIAWRL